MKVDYPIRLLFLYKFLWLFEYLLEDILEYLEIYLFYNQLEPYKQEMNTVRWGEFGRKWGEFGRLQKHTAKPTKV